MTAHPFQITAPTGITVQPGGAGTFQVVNSGTEPITVHGTLGRFTVHALRYPAASDATLTSFGRPWLTVWPGTFTLAPGQAETVHIAAKVPAGAQGDHWLNVVWSAQPAAHHAAGNLHLAGAVATSVLIPLPGTAVPVTGRGVAGAPPAPVHGGGIPGLALAVIIPAVLAVIVLVLALRRRLRRRPA